MRSQLVIGAGEVGTAVFDILSNAYKDIWIRDIEDVDVEAEILHICIPWFDGFVDVVNSYKERHQANLIIIHSTVPVGVCDQNGWVFSPMRGRHPKLSSSLLIFTKHVGGHRAEEASFILMAAGIKVKVHDRAADLEAGKVWELIQFGVQIRVEKAIYQWCEENGLDFNVVYTEMAKTYNEGYDLMGYGKFVRPVLDHIDGPIGGHCVRQNASLIDHQLSRMVTDEDS